MTYIELGKQKQDIITEARLAHPDWTSYEVAKYANTDRITAKRVLRKAGLRVKSINWPKRKPGIRPIKKEWGKDNLRQLYYIDGLTLAQIGNIYGVTRERVRQVMERVDLKRIKRLRRGENSILFSNQTRSS